LADAEARLRDFDETLAQTRDSTAEAFPDSGRSRTVLRLSARRSNEPFATRQGRPLSSFGCRWGSDDTMKFGESGDSYYVTLPDAGADFIIRTTAPDEMFVSYLRRSFRCGEFPGWNGFRNIPKELLNLGSGLLPV
jgi:hypothetical protein